MAVHAAASAWPATRSRARQQRTPGRVAGGAGTPRGAPPMGPRPSGRSQPPPQLRLRSPVPSGRDAPRAVAVAAEPLLQDAGLCSGSQRLVTSGARCSHVLFSCRLAGSTYCRFHPVQSQSACHSERYVNDDLLTDWGFPPLSFLAEGEDLFSVSETGDLWISGLSLDNLSRGLTHSCTAAGTCCLRAQLATPDAAQPAAFPAGRAAPPRAPHVSGPAALQHAGDAPALVRAGGCAASQRRGWGCGCAAACTGDPCAYCGRLPCLVREPTGCEFKLPSRSPRPSRFRESFELCLHMLQPSDQPPAPCSMSDSSLRHATCQTETDLLRLHSLEP